MNNRTMQQSLATGSGSTHNALPETRIRRVQALSGMAFSIFLAMHLVNTVAGLAGADTYNSLQQGLQRVYQHPLFESLFIIAPLLIHATTGLVSFNNARKLGLGKAGMQWWHSAAGLFLVAVVFMHMAATRGVGFFYNAPPGFDGVAFTLWWLPMLFYPYYLLLFLAGSYHMFYGIGMLLARAGLASALAVKRLVRILTACACIAACAALLAFGGHFFEVTAPYDNDYARVYGNALGLEFGEAP